MGCKINFITAVLFYQFFSCVLHFVAKMKNDIGHLSYNCTSCDSDVGAAWFRAETNPYLDHLHVHAPFVWESERFEADYMHLLAHGLGSSNFKYR